MTRRRTSQAAVPLSPAGEELLELAGRSLDASSRDELRRTMSAWARRYRRRPRAAVSEDAALVALTVSYLRKLRDDG